MITLLLVIQVPDTGDKRSMPLTLCPIDGFALRISGSEHFIRMVFNTIIVDTAALRTTLGQASTKTFAIRLLGNHIAADELNETFIGRTSLDEDAFYALRQKKERHTLAEDKDLERER